MHENTLQRNISIDIVKLFASLFVVFLHAPFPGSFGSLIITISRFAVPYFLIVSGFYNYGTNLHTLKKRFFSTGKLLLFSSLFYLSWYCIRITIWNGSIFSYLSTIATVTNILNFIFLNINPISDHLWYIGALAYCYVFLYLYTRFLYKRFRYRLLYILGFCTLAITLALDGPISNYIIYVPHYFYRNAWFVGISSFILGIFLRDAISKTSCNSSKSYIMIAGGIAITFLQKNTIGMAEISAGSYLTAVGLLLFCLAHPTISVRSKKNHTFLVNAGKYSTIVYVVHLFLIDLYTAECQNEFSRLFGGAEAYLRPFIIFFSSVLIAIMYNKFTAKYKHN